MRKKIIQHYRQFIAVYLVKNGVLIKLFDSVNPTDTMIDKYIDSQSIDRVFEYKVTGKAIQKVLNGGTITPREETLNFIANLFHVSPKSFNEFNTLWLKNEITEAQLLMPPSQQHIQDKTKKPKTSEFSDELDDSQYQAVEIEQIQFFSWFSVMRVKKIFGKIKQINIFGSNNKQEIDNGE